MFLIEGLDDQNTFKILHCSDGKVAKGVDFLGR